MSVSDLNILKPNYCHRKKGTTLSKLKKGKPCSACMNSSGLASILDNNNLAAYFKRLRKEYILDFGNT